MRFLYLWTITTTDNLWIYKSRALNRFGGLKTCLDTTFQLIIIRTRLIGLLIYFLGSYKKTSKKKKP